MRYLITGGAGFIGSNLALRLEADLGAEAVVLDDFSSGHFENLSGFRGDVITSDVASGDWESKAGPVDAVFHQAAITDTTLTDQRRMMEANVEGFRRVLEFARRRNVKRIVYASSAGVYGNGPWPMKESQPPQPLNVYAFSKLAAEHLAARFAHEHPGTILVGLRYFNVYGPRENHKGTAASMIYQLHRQMRQGRPPRIFKYGEQSRDFVYVKDVVSANLKALEARRGGVVNIASGNPVTFNRVIDVLNGILNSSLSPDYFDNPYPFYQEKTAADLRTAKALLGYHPEFSIEGGMRDYLGGRLDAVSA